MISLLVKQKRGGKKEERVINHVRSKRFRVTSTELTKEIGVSKTYTLTLMKKIASKNPCFIFDNGDRSRGVSATLLYLEEKEIEIRKKKLSVIKQLIQDKEKLVMQEVMVSLNLDFKEARELSEIFCKENEEYYYDEGLNEPENVPIAMAATIKLKKISTH